MARLRERITASVRLIERKQYKDGPKDFPAHPRPWLPQAVASRGSWSGIRPLEGIIQIPVLRPDGTILAIPGYDEATGLLYEPASSVAMSVPDKPGQDDAKNAVETLWDVVSDFPFAEASKHFSGWLAAVLTPIARFAFDGPSPLFLYDGNTPGTGKGLLVDVTSEIAVGREFARIPYSANDEEMRKRITSLALAGDTTVLLDNVDAPLGGASLDAALTATRWEDRLLSTNTVFSGPLRATWYATGNNVELTGDTPRRILQIRLQTPLENPEERQDFRYPDLKVHVRQCRDLLVYSALTILRGYVVAGRPSFGLTPWGSFECWSDLIRNAVVWSGQQDPGDARMTKVLLGNQDATVLARLIAGLEQVDPQRRGMTTAQIAGLVTGTGYVSPLLYDVVTELAGEPSGTVNKKKLGKQVARLCGRVSSGLRLSRVEDRHYKVAQWKVEVV